MVARGVKNEIDQSDWNYLRRRDVPVSGDGPTVKIVDLFAGCGGMSLGASEALRAAGRCPEISLSVELLEPIRKIYDANFKSRVRSDRSDVWDRFDGKVGAKRTNAERATRKTLGATHLLVGGPPCQGHSDLNNHTRRNDPKNDLYMRMVRAAEVLEPDAIIIENVPGVRHAEENVVELARRRLDRLGYEVEDVVVAVAALGVPQLRTRHILVATEHVIPGTLRVQLKERNVANVRTLRWAIEDLVNVEPLSLFDRGSTLSPDNRTRAAYLLEHDAFDLPNKLRPDCHKNKPHHRYKSMYGRLTWDEPAQTITTGFGSPGQGRYLHPTQMRTLTPHEAARLQFFPDFFDFGGTELRKVLAEAIGNAVPPKLAFAITQAIYSPASTRTDGVKQSSTGHLQASR